MFSPNEKKITKEIKKTSNITQNTVIKENTMAYGNDKITTININNFVKITLHIFLKRINIFFLYNITPSHFNKKIHLYII